MPHDPHALHQILLKIREQMRCPQCSEMVQVDMPSVKLAGDDFLLLQLKCECCQAFIVLHVSLTGQQVPTNIDGLNASSHLTVSEDELKHLRSALKDSGGSFGELFKKLENSAAGGSDGPTKIV